MTAAQRSKAEVDALYRRAVATRRTMYELMQINGGIDGCPEPVFDGIIELGNAITEYHRSLTRERTFNALRDAIRRAEAEIDNYKQHKTEEKL